MLLKDGNLGCHMRNLLFSILSALLIATTFNTAAQDTDPTGQTIIFWHPYSGGQNTAINTLIETFNETNAYGVTVQGTLRGSADSLREQVENAIDADDLPNIVTGFPNDAANYALREVVVDLNLYVDDPAWGFTDAEIADFNADILNASVFEETPFNGARLAWSNHASANVLAVNLTMLEALNFDLPQTFEEFTTLACEAYNYETPQGRFAVGYPIRLEASNFESYLASRGGQIYRDSAYDFTSESALATFQFYQDLYNDGCAYIPESRFGNTDDFARGLAPMAMTSTAGIPFILEGFDISGLDDEWTVTTTPWTDDNRTLQAFLPGMIVFKSTPEAELASWLFLKFLAEPEQQAAWSRATAYFPARLSASELLTDYAAADPYFAAANALLNNPEVKLYTAPKVSSYGEVRVLIAQAMEDITLNGEDVAAVAERLQEEANRIHKQS
jgi:ABC-type glycerol-3-phosphate transport system substrate-binding protein